MTQAEEDTAFHLSRRLFVIVDGQVKSVEPGRYEFHEDWFRAEGLIPPAMAYDAREDFLFRNLRGYALNGSLYAYRLHAGNAFSGHNVPADLVPHLAALRDQLNLDPETIVWAGIHPTRGAWEGKRRVGRLGDLCAAYAKELDRGHVDPP